MLHRYGLPTLPGGLAPLYKPLRNKQPPSSKIRNTMLPLIFMCFIQLLEHPVAQGQPDAEISNHNANQAVVSNSDSSPFGFPDPPVAYLPPCEEEFYDTKHKKTVRKRSAGRQVTLPPDVVNKLMDKPISDLFPSLEINRKMILDSHNKYRSKANPPASNMLELMWSDEAAQTAEAWAKQCIQGHSNATQRTIPNFRCGENIFLAPYKLTWDVVTDCWFSEFVDFLFGTGSINGAEVGHYTQLMWGSSSLIGCGVAECPNLVNKFNFVCHYCPLGNQKPTSVPYKSGKACGECPNACANNLCRNRCPHMDKFINCKDFKTGDTCGNDVNLIEDCSAMCKCTKGEIK